MSDDTQRPISDSAVESRLEKIAKRGIAAQHTVNESADKIRLDTKVKRGSGTRDQDTVKVQVKGDDPDEAAGRLADTLDALTEHGVADTLRATQPGGADDE